MCTPYTHTKRTRVHNKSLLKCRGHISNWRHGMDLPMIPSAFQKTENYCLWFLETSQRGKCYKPPTYCIPLFRSHRVLMFHAQPPWNSEVPIPALRVLSYLQCGQRPLWDVHSMGRGRAGQGQMEIVLMYV